MAKLSVVINAQNSEKDLLRALNSIKKLADEVVVVDQGSTDSTEKLQRILEQKSTIMNLLNMLNWRETLQLKKPLEIGFLFWTRMRR